MNLWLVVGVSVLCFSFLFAFLFFFSFSLPKVLWRIPHSPPPLSRHLLRNPNRSKCPSLRRHEDTQTREPKEGKGKKKKNLRVCVCEVEKKKRRKKGSFIVGSFVGSQNGGFFNGVKDIWWRTFDICSRSSSFSVSEKGKSLGSGTFTSGEVSHRSTKELERSFHDTFLLCKGSISLRS